MGKVLGGNAEFSTILRAVEDGRLSGFITVDKRKSVVSTSFLKDKAEPISKREWPQPNCIVN